MNHKLRSFGHKFGRGAVLSALVALVACGASSDRTGGSDDSEQTRTTAQALTGPTTYPINVMLPTGTSIVDTTVGAAGSILYNANDKILGPTGSAGGEVSVEINATSSSITTVGSAEVDPGSTVNGNISAGGNVQVDLGGTVNGNVSAGGQIVAFGKVTGSKTKQPGPTSSTTSWSVTNPGNSQGPISLLLNATASPVAGTYDSVFVGPGSSLYLHSGTYFFQSLDVELGANLVVDSSQGPVFVYVTSSLLIFRGSETSVDASSPRLFMAFLGNLPVQLEAPFQGVFLAPNAPQLHLADALWVLDPVKQPMGNRATFYSNSILVDQGEIIAPSRFDWSTVPGFPVPPGGWTAVGGPNGSGATGNTGRTVTGTIPPPAVSFHLSTVPAPATPLPEPARPPTNNATIAPTAPVPFHVPATFDVGGELANGTATLTYTSCTGGTVTCTYQGGSSTAKPTDVEDLEAGRTATFVSCSDAQPVTALRCGSSFSLSTNGVPDWPVSIDLALDDRSCETKVDLLTPVQTRKMLDNFKWPDPNLTTPPLVAETTKDSKGNTIPDLYYAWVYLQNAEDVLHLRQMYVHILSKPLYQSELETYAGQCVIFQNPGDGGGTFVPVVMPGKVYNTLINVQNYKFDDNQNPKIKHDQPPIFKAVILRSTTPIDFATLKNSGFRYLDYERGPVAQSAMKLQGGAASEVFQDVLTFALQTVQDVQTFVTNALGNLDAIFAGRANYNMQIEVDNDGAPFTQPYAVEGWGTQAGQPLGAGGFQVTLYENLFGVIPETFTGYTDNTGTTSISVAKHSSSDIGGAGFCVTLSNSAIWETSTLLPNAVCNLQGFDRLEVGLATSVTSNPINVPDFSQDQNFTIVMGEKQLSTAYYATDAWNYLRRVSGDSVPTAHALVGDMANFFGLFNGGRAFTFALHLRNGGAGFDINNVLGPYINAWSTGYPQLIDTTLNVAGQTLGVLTAVAVPIFSNNDIVFPDSAIDFTGSGAREVGAHEMGHYLFMAMLHEENPAAIDFLVGDSLVSFQSENYSYPTRYINEAFADFITGQTTGMANYQWLTKAGPGQGSVAQNSGVQGTNGKVCMTAPCFDENFSQGPDGTSGSKLGISRFASLLHDAFDGQSLEVERNRDQPNNADPWVSKQSSPATSSSPALFSTTGPYSFTPNTWGDYDGPDPFNNLVPACRIGTGPSATSISASTPACVASESVALPGSSLVDFAHKLADISSAGSLPHLTTYLTDEHVYRALDYAMVQRGYNWCQRCQVLALHVSENTVDPNSNTDSIAPNALLKLCDRNDGQSHPGEDSSLASWKLPSVSSSDGSPDPDARIDSSTCVNCPADKFPDGNGQCTQDCPADFVVDGNTFPLAITGSETTASSIPPAPDPCPNLFVVEIDNPQQFFARGAATITATVSVDSRGDSTCDRSFTLSLSDLPASSTTGYVPEQTVTKTGFFDDDAGALNLNCREPGIQLTPSTLTSGSFPIRFSTPVIGGVSLDLNTSTTQPPPP